MSNQISVILGKVLDTDRKIISTLKKKEPDLEKINTLYSLRDKQIKTLSELKNDAYKEIETLEESPKKMIRHQFSQLNLLEQKIQKELKAVTNQKKAELESVILKNKVKNSYTNDSKNVISKSIHLDITST